MKSKTQRFIGEQVYYMKQMARGPVPLSIWRRWDQRQMLGLHDRGMCLISARYEMKITQLGWSEIQKTASPKIRNHPEKPTFKVKGRRSEERRVASR